MAPRSGSAFFAAMLTVGAASAAQADTARACLDESERIVGARAVLTGKERPAPRKLRDVPLEFPTRQGSSTARSTIWLGDALVDATGKVRAVWTLRPLRFEPAWPEFDEAIAAGIRQWTYEPPLVDGRSTPVCVTVSVAITWK
jgi:hypothetical protein